jgi:fructokinase
MARGKLANEAQVRKPPMSIAVVGEALVDFIAGQDGAYRPHFGGSPYNVAIGLARQGIDVSYLSVLSDDVFGDRISEALRREGVRLPITRRSLWPTSLALVTIDEQGLPSYRLYREGVADKDTTFEEVVENLPEDVEIFHTGSLAITPSQLPKIHRVFDLLKPRGVLISVDINVRLRASMDTSKYLGGIRSVLRVADIVKASDEDLEALNLGVVGRKAAALVHAEMQGGLLLFTAGRGGAVLFSRHGVSERKFYPVARIEDTVGAGDSFHSAFLAELCRRGTPGRLLDGTSAESLAGAVEFACAAAAINVSRKGCSPPTAREVYEFMNSTRC